MRIEVRRETFACVILVGPNRGYYHIVNGILFYTREDADKYNKENLNGSAEILTYSLCAESK